MPLGHLWFDFSDTIASVNRQMHDDIKYGAYAELTGQSDTPALRESYRELYEKYGRSNNNVFVREFGKPPKYWSDLIGQYATKGLYELTDPSIPAVLTQLSKRIPVSVFSNVDTYDTMQSLGIDVSGLTHVLSASELANPKPHTEGYLKLIALSGIPAAEILYVGDIEEKDIAPAKAVGLKAGMIWTRSDTADYNFANFQDIVTLVEHEAA